MTQDREQTTSEYISIEEAAVRAGVSSITLRRHVKAGHLHYRAQRGQQKLLRASEVDAWARERNAVHTFDNNQEGTPQ